MCVCLLNFCVSVVELFVSDIVVVMFCSVCSYLMVFMLGVSVILIDVSMNNVILLVNMCLWLYELVIVFVIIR